MGRGGGWGSGTRWVQVFQACQDLGRLQGSRLVHHTLDMTCLLPLLGAEREVPRGPEGPVRVGLTDRALGQGGSVLDPEHGEFFWVVAVQVTGQRESGGARGHGDGRHLDGGQDYNGTGREKRTTR